MKEKDIQNLNKKINALGEIIMTKDYEIRKWNEEMEGKDERLKRLRKEFDKS